MQTIKICHLYYDLMNLYGENGNVRAFKKNLEANKIKTEIHFVTVDDKINFENYDIFYIGCGCEENFRIVLADILKYKKEINNIINENKLFISTGNSINLFGEYYELLNGEKLDCLNIFNYSTRELDFRIVGEQVYSTKLINKKIIGFSNRNSILLNNSNPLFEVINGTGDSIKGMNEGYNYKNFFATNLLGPLLIRNPHLTNYLLKNFLSINNIKYTTIRKGIEFTAYDEFIKNFVES